MTLTDTSRMEVEVVGWRRRVDDGVEHVVYEMVVRFGELQWRVERRYSEFAAIDKIFELAVKLPKAHTPATVAYSLSTRLARRRFAESGGQVAETRLADMHLYAENLAREKSGYAAVLEFFGAAQRMRTESMHARSLACAIRAGDLILFQSLETVSVVQRAVTRSEWDHVALVVETKLGSRLLLEATADGVASVHLISRIRSYGASKLAVRQIESPLSLESKRALADFAESVDGEDYGVGIGQLIDGVVSRRTREPTSCFCNRTHDEGDNSKRYFCSQLTAKALQVAKVVRDDIPASYFWPGSFSTGSLDPFLRKGVRYGPEVRIELAIPEVAHSAKRRKKRGSKVFSTKPS